MNNNEFNPDKRYEILFVYAVKNANPNGDPANENMPRFDENTETIFVSDARIKRTIRDYIARKHPDKIFLKKKINLDNIKVNENEIKDMIKKYWDLKMFGFVPATKESDKLMNALGPLQFRFGNSLNKVEIKYIKGTSSIIRNKTKQTGSFNEKFIVPYAIISVYGIYNPNVAKEQDIEITKEDIKLIFESLWNGTAELQTSSKTTHEPLLLLYVEQDDNSFFGNLDEFIRIKNNKGEDITYDSENSNNGKNIRKITDYSLDLTKLVEIIGRDKIKIWKKHPALKINPDLGGA